MLINVAAIKKIVKSKERRIAKEALILIDKEVNRIVEKLCETHNGGKMTIDESVVALTLGVAK